MTILACETSCDETSVAIVRGGVVLANVVSSQVRLHSEYGGVVPELATREHLRNFPSVARAALAQAGLHASDLDGIAATLGPGLPNALLVGVRAAQSMAYALRRPFLAVHHHEAHLYSPWVTGDPMRVDFAGFTPNVSLIVSGGHTLLVHVESPTRHRVLGGTLDDAAGECFDKSAKLLGLPYPGGPALERLASGGNPSAFPLPRPLLSAPNDDFSFSGLKTAVRLLLDRHPDRIGEIAWCRDVAASVQAAIVDVLVAKTFRAARRLNVRCVTASGGVTMNGELRRQLAAGARQARCELRLAPPGLCTDNAAMVAALAAHRWSLDPGADTTDVDAEIRPGWTLESLPAEAHSRP